jgi:hypothetical protein
MNTIEIAKKLAELCQQGRNVEALDILFARMTWLVWKPLRCLVRNRK